MIRNINGKDYTFGMTRKGIRAAERLGMDFDEIESHPMSTVAYLWYASIYAAHPMNFDKATDLMDDYLDQNEESFTDLMNTLSDELMGVFGVAAE